MKDGWRLQQQFHSTIIHLGHDHVNSCVKKQIRMEIFSIVQHGNFPFDLCLTTALLSCASNQEEVGTILLKLSRSLRGCRLTVLRRPVPGLHSEARRSEVDPEHVTQIHAHWAESPTSCPSAQHRVCVARPPDAQTRDSKEQRCQLSAIHGDSHRHLVCPTCMAFYEFWREVPQIDFKTWAWTPAMNLLSKFTFGVKTSSTVISNELCVRSVK